MGWLAQSGGVAPALLRSHAYTLRGNDVARHAFRVASGLDSMVLGEAQMRWLNEVEAYLDGGKLPD